MAGTGKKKNEPIVGLGNEDKLTVQKSLPLFALWRSELTLSEFKILDTYLSRIDSHKPEKRQVVLRKGEIEQALGVQKINNQDLKSRLKHLMGNVVELPDKDIKKGFRLVTLFEEAEAEQDDYGLWQVRLECTQNAMKYFFNVENLGYLRYKLRCITSLTSRYTYIMFIYLEANRFRKSWNVALDELKSILHCDNEEYAKEFKYFNRDVLKKVQKELLEKTECRYSYEPIKKGRKVVAVRFAVETLSDILPDTAPDESQISFDDVEKLLSTDHGQVLYMLSGACQDEFTTEQMEILFTLCTSKCIPQVSENPNNDKYHYLAKMYAKLNYEATKKNIPYRFSYFQTMIENDEL